MKAPHAMNNQNMIKRCMQNVIKQKDIKELHIIYKILKIINVSLM